MSMVDSADDNGLNGLDQSQPDLRQDDEDTNAKTKGPTKGL